MLYFYCTVLLLLLLPVPTDRPTDRPTALLDPGASRHVRPSCRAPPSCLSPLLYRLPRHRHPTSIAHGPSAARVHLANQGPLVDVIPSSHRRGDRQADGWMDGWMDTMYSCSPATYMYTSNYRPYFACPLAPSQPPTPSPMGIKATRTIRNATGCDVQEGGRRKRSQSRVTIGACETCLNFCWKPIPFVEIRLRPNQTRQRPLRHT